ncbi:hypothetical protein A2524_00230 [Candidatus Wolfebacteria bacterium RIFOXYD12_FULL_48_21]|uniref:DUF1648 domain-containing protein n=1 Tax=Candidatus Wolfebacteria bacterium RIFOXYD1_FULL_48_65 TaxID=1802561 RepID=A0A1F8E3W2_9BACT|nr:MAG: hypothetical protein A2524_00230 [Candidatus Wolfebacteria bacterium RIFOXYD12_FULL_48_21]OGM95472.1 MAG: hypothetical protein A2610_01110 [Candidatus Wolfebacteria bacterium RIFOXYD1_FULL_48_65]OGM97111.1 MAG: hypothetical protein A2532_02980 [Candidatus Wolfebacteria bacterium RIFOXYD2_FULL_48_11]
MKTIKGTIAWIVIGLTWVTAIVLYDGMPARMATHWNAAGVADGYAGKAFALFLIPAIMLLVQGLFVLIPKIDPLRKNIEAFREQFEGFALLLSVFMAYLFVLIMLWSKGALFSMTVALMPAFASMFYGMGSLLKGIKRNWFVGIRTPWTMSSDVVWDKTHALGSRLFKVSGVVILAGVVLPQYAVWFMVGPILASTLISVVYSYRVFKKENK